MGKIKKKKNLSEQKSIKPKKQGLNPFEVHFNRQKFNVLGRQVKTDRGLPGVARAKALKKRKETLLQEYKVQHKTNKFFDKRIGEKNSAMTNEDRIIARFSAERMKTHKKKSLFNLADDDVLTHKGQSLAEIERFEDPDSDEDDNLDGWKGLNARFVEEASFGGGMLKENRTNRASIIDQLIAESKKRKAERQMAKEKTLQRTEELDAEWKELMPVVNIKVQHDDVVEKKDAYDKIIGELKFEPRGTPSDKLKSESEIVEQEARKLTELEQERLARMRGEETEAIKTQHKSADDLDDGFEIEEEPYVLTYDKDGKLIGFDKDNENQDVTVKKKKTPLEGNETDDDDEEEEEEGSDVTDSENGVEDESETKEGHKTTENEDEIEADGSDAESDDLADLKVNPDAEDDEKDDEDVKQETQYQLVKGNKKVSFSTVIQEVMYTENEPKISDEEKNKLMKEAESQLPFTFEAPNDYDELQDLFDKRTPEEQAVILERMIKCNHPHLSENNKAKLETLFAFLMQHMNDLETLESWRILDRLAPLLFDIAQFSPNNAAYCLSEVIAEKQSDYKSKKHKYPSPQTLLFLKLVPLLFPTSDKRHPVTTPAFVFISAMLQQCHVTTRRSIASGLFLVSLLTEYVWLSKRVMPEALNFLCGLIYMAAPSSKLPVVPPFKQENKFLYLQSPADMEMNNMNMDASDLETKAPKIDNTFRVKSIHCTLQLLNMFVNLYEEMPAARLLFQPIKNHVAELEVSKYPSLVKKVHENLMESLDKILNIGLTPIVMEAKKPKVLRLYEPSIQRVYDNKKKKPGDEKNEHSKLLHKYKMEMKGAVREIRRDRSFVANLKFKEQAANDAERKRKVKEIYSWGAQQEGDYKKLKRKK